MAKFSEYLERKLERLRLGQAACEIVTLPSDPEMRLALVPLIEAEYTNSLHEADKALAGDNPAGMALRDETQRVFVIYHAAREVGQLDQKWFDTPQEVGELDASEINYLYDIYLEMVAQGSPSLAGLSEDDFLALKLSLQRIEWSELSGPQWYAAERFLNSIRPLLLTGKSSGSQSTMKLIQKNDEPDNAPSAE